jgi:hypothetical protein
MLPHPARTRGCRSSLQQPARLDPSWAWTAAGQAQHSNKACHTDLVTRHQQTNYGLLLVLDIHRTLFEVTSTTPQTELHISVHEGRGLASDAVSGGWLATPCRVVVVVVKATTVRRRPHVTRKGKGAAGHPPEPEFHISADKGRWHIRLQAHHQGVMRQPATHVSLNDLATREWAPASNPSIRVRDTWKPVRSSHCWVQ